MENSGVAQLFPAGTRLIRLFAEPGLPPLPGWDDAGMELCKSRSRGRAVRGNGVFLKEYVYTSPWDKFRQRFKTPRPFVSLEAARRLEELGVPTPPVAAAVRGVSPDGCVHDLLVTKELAPGVVFGDKLAAELGDKRISLARELVPLAFRMHEGGLIHGDLSLRNWYRTPEGVWGLIDLDGAKVLRGAASKSRRTDELARLASSCFTAATQVSDGIAELRRFIRNFFDEYARCGGAVDLGRFARRSRFLADRFRTRYLDMDVLK